MANYYGVTRSEEYLEHYGVKGMKWGVKKALASGDSRKLDRAYRKASRKLAKLERQANSGAKYARRAAVLGAGAAAAGGLAAAGTSGVASAIKKIGGHGGQAMVGGGNLVKRAGEAMTRHGIRGGGRVAAAGSAINRAGSKVSTGMYQAGRGLDAWGKGTAFKLDNAKSRHFQNAATTWRDNAIQRAGSGDLKGAQQSLAKMGNRLKKSENAKTAVSNNTLARVGAAALGAGLAGAAGYNAYRAATTKRAAKKAQEWRSEMNKAFAGTKYANGGSGNSSSRKRRRRG